MLLRWLFKKYIFLFIYFYFPIQQSVKIFFLRVATTQFYWNVQNGTPNYLDSTVQHGTTTTNWPCEALIRLAQSQLQETHKAEVKREILAQAREGPELRSKQKSGNDKMRCRQLGTRNGERIRCQNARPLPALFCPPVNPRPRQCPLVSPVS